MGNNYFQIKLNCDEETGACGTRGYRALNTLHRQHSRKTIRLMGNKTTLFARVTFVLFANVNYI